MEFEINAFEKQLLLKRRKALKRTQVTSALKPIDKKVIDAFYNQEPMEGKILETDGVTLEKITMGRQAMAKWVGSKIEFIGDIGVKSDEVITRALRKFIPKLIWSKPPPKI